MKNCFSDLRVQRTLELRWRSGLRQMVLWTSTRSGQNASNPHNSCSDCGCGVYQIPNLSHLSSEFDCHLDFKPHEILAPNIISTYATAKANEIVCAASHLTKNPRSGLHLGAIVGQSHVKKSLCFFSSLKSGDRSGRFVHLVGFTMSISCNILRSLWGFFFSSFPSPYCLFGRIMVFRDIVNKYGKSPSTYAPWESQDQGIRDAGLGPIGENHAASHQYFLPCSFPCRSDGRANYTLVRSLALIHLLDCFFPVQSKSMLQPT